MRLATFNSIFTKLFKKVIPAAFKTYVNDSDNFLTKIVKYIPAEIITAYTAALGVWSTDPPPVGSQKTYTFVLYFILVITPIWTYFAVLDNKNNTEPPTRKKRDIFMLRLHSYRLLFGCMH